MIETDTPEYFFDGTGLDVDCGGFEDLITLDDTPVGEGEGEEEIYGGEFGSWDGKAHDAVIPIGDGDMLFLDEDSSGFETSDCIF